MTKKLLWLDDLRNPEERIWLDKLVEFEINPFHYDIVWVKSYAEFVEWIELNNLPAIISFDHDLADEHYTPEEYWDDYDRSKTYQDIQMYQEKTGMDCAKWLVNYCMDNGEELPKFYVHSANPVGADNIRGLLNNYLKYFQQ